MKIFVKGLHRMLKFVALLHVRAYGDNHVDSDNYTLTSGTDVCLMDLAVFMKQ